MHQECSLKSQKGSSVQRALPLREGRGEVHAGTRRCPHSKDTQKVQNAGAGAAIIATPSDTQILAAELGRDEFFVI